MDTSSQAVALDDAKTIISAESEIVTISHPLSPYTVPHFLLLNWKCGDTRTAFKRVTNLRPIRHQFLHTRLDQLEQEQLEKFYQYCKEKGIEVDANNTAVLGRLLLQNTRNLRKQYRNMEFPEHALEEKILQHIVWRQEQYDKLQIPISDQEGDLELDLKQGAMYWFGRNFEYRPVVILDVQEMMLIPEERFWRLAVFTFEFGRRYLLVPGIVETCVLVIDPRQATMWQLRNAVGRIQNLTSQLTRLYPFSVDQNICVTNSNAIELGWKLVKPFMTELQQYKTRVVKANNPEETWQHLQTCFAKCQLQKKFGGNHPDLREFYPFKMPPGPYAAGCTEKSNPKGDIPHSHVCMDAITARGICFRTKSPPWPLLLDPGPTREFCRRNGLPVPLLVREELDNFISSRHITDGFQRLLRLSDSPSTQKTRPSQPAPLSSRRRDATLLHRVSTTNYRKVISSPRTNESIVTLVENVMIEKVLSPSSNGTSVFFSAQEDDCFDPNQSSSDANQILPLSTLRDEYLDNAINSFMDGGNLSWSQVFQGYSSISPLCRKHSSVSDSYVTAEVLTTHRDSLSSGCKHEPKTQVASSSLPIINSEPMPAALPSVQNSEENSNSSSRRTSLRQSLRLLRRGSSQRRRQEYTAASKGERSMVRRFSNRFRRLFSNCYKA